MCRPSFMETPSFANGCFCLLVAAVAAINISSGSVSDSCRLSPRLSSSAQTPCQVPSQYSASPPHFSCAAADLTRAGIPFVSFFAPGTGCIYQLRQDRNGHRLQSYLQNMKPHRRVRQVYTLVAIPSSHVFVNSYQNRALAVRPSHHHNFNRRRRHLTARFVHHRHHCRDGHCNHHGYQHKLHH